MQFTRFTRHAASAIALAGCASLAFLTKKPVLALESDEWREFRLVSSSDLTHNSKLFRFSDGRTQPIRTSAYYVAQCPSDSKVAMKPYTPINAEGDHAYVDFVIKEYANGTLSRHIHSLQIGDTLLMKGPHAKFAYSANMKKRIGMIAGGTGIAPMLQVIRSVLNDKSDRTQVDLVYSNHTPEDVMMKDELEHMMKQHPGQLRVTYCSSVGGNGFTGHVGRVTPALLRNTLPPPSDDNMIMVCGTPSMVSDVCGPKGENFTQGPVSGMLKELGYNEEQVFKF